MKKKLLLLTVFFCMLLFTACKGTTITSTTKFNQDGSGIRTVSAVLSKKDVKKMNLSFEQLDKLLEGVAPEAVNLSRTMDDNNKDATYEFSFAFSDIADYNQKIQEITAESHDATWYSDSSIFKSDINFSETQCTYDLVKWAFKALEKAGYSGAFDSLDLYEIGNNNIYYNNKLVYQESGENDSPSFQIPNAQLLKKISAYSKYDRNGKLSKQFVLEFNKKNFSKLNMNMAKSLLSQYSSEFNIDKKKATITLNLDSEEKIRDFLSKADDSYQADNLKYQMEDSTPFVLHFAFMENYNLSKFFNNFAIDTEYINNYLALPENIDYEDRIYYEPNEADETQKGYQYASKYRVTDTYKTNFTANHQVSVSDIHVLYEMKKGYHLALKTTFTLYQMDGNLSIDRLKAYYQKKADDIEVESTKDAYTVTLTNLYVWNGKKDTKSELSHFVRKKNTLLRKEDEYRSVYQLKDYIPIDSNAKIEYEFNIATSLGLKKLVYNGKNLLQDSEGSNSDNKKSVSVEYHEAEGYRIKLTEGNLTKSNIKMEFVTTKPIIPYIVVLFILIVIVTVIVISMKDLRNNEDSTVLDNWITRVKNIIQRLRKEKEN
ncbi:hypothetical protein [Anaeromicropila herbilytica]|uniref:Lipoprotein n=1 Tax=Anaeromicropila herbilytica TaxID=2785025 RepID=A0A7R7IFE3_9FIRM|nr:hypothetical protein [Anaeromicropila herbilytica]BCN32048.1 hypothetical protein bsdtb5_33430 [Anaeromicropila herbilytica]